jgi:hypothetical protein
MNEDKSLEEVREWKRKVYEETKNLTSDEVIKYFNESADKIIKDNNLNLKFASKEKKDKKAI